VLLKKSKIQQHCLICLKKCNKNKMELINLKVIKNKVIQQHYLICLKKWNKNKIKVNNLKALKNKVEIRKI